MEWLLTGKGKMYKENTIFDSNYDTAPQILNSQAPESSPRQESIIAPAAQNKPSGRDVDHIVIFYSDNTFETFRPGTSAI